MTEGERQHLGLMSLKIAMLEDLVKNMLASGFEAFPTPVEAAHQFADQYRQAWASTSDRGDPASKIQVEEVWNEFLDGLVLEVQRRRRLSKP